MAHAKKTAAPAANNYYRQQTEDPELSVIIRCLKQLQGLNFDQRVSALRYIHSRLGIRRDLV